MIAVMSDGEQEGIDSTKNSAERMLALSNLPDLKDETTE